MYQFIIIVHVLLGLGIVGLVLMQQGKGADAGAAFGSGASGSIFGAQGAASFLSRTTAIFATLFFITSLSLAVLGSKQAEKPADIMAPTNTLDDAKADVPLSQGATDSAPVVPDSQPTAVTETKLPDAPIIKEVPVLGSEDQTTGNKQ